MSALAEAARNAPHDPGIYCLLGTDRELLYAGMATNLHKRLAQHAHAKPGRGARLDHLYASVCDVRWVATADDVSAANLEADVIVALRPRFNAAISLDGRWNFVAVEPGPRDNTRFRLTHDVDSRVHRVGGRAYGCFPHLGRGVASRPAIACSDGYTALLRLLWAASSSTGGHYPTRVTRSAPDLFDVVVAPSLDAPLRAFLSGTAPRLLDDLAAFELPAGTEHLAPGIARDRVSARGFYEVGPRALRRLRLRHSEPTGPVSRNKIEALVFADLCAAIGDLAAPRPVDPADRHLGSRAHPWARA